MDKPNGYDEVQAYGEFQALPPGGYICKILKTEERNTTNGMPMIAAVLDIVEGEYKDYFRNLFDERKKNNTDITKQIKYPNDGIAYIFVYEYQSNKTSRQFKSFCQAIEDSGTQIVWGENFQNSIQEANIGVVFRREQEEYNGKLYWHTKPYVFKSCESIKKGDYKIPDDKAAKQVSVSDDSPFGSDEPFPDSFEKANEDIPF